MRRLSTVLALLIVVAGIAACKSKPDDEVIAKDIQSKIAASSTAQDSQIAVMSNEGKVTLKGSTNSRAAQQEIVQIAKAEPGVTDVDDETSTQDSAATSTSEAGSPNVGRFAPPPTAPTPPPPPPPPPPPVVVPAGTVLTVRVNQALSTKTAKTGTSFTGSLMTPITIDGKMAIPSGSDVVGTVTQAQKAGKFKGGATLNLTLSSLTVHGHTYNIVTELFGQESKGKGKRTAGMMAGGAGVGAAIGGLAGGGKGAAIGALAGVTAGTLGAMTGNRDIELPAESALNFKLDQQLTLKPDSGQ